MHAPTPLEQELPGQSAPASPPSVDTSHDGPPSEELSDASRLASVDASDAPPSEASVAASSVDASSEPSATTSAEPASMGGGIGMHCPTEGLMHTQCALGAAPRHWRASFRQAWQPARPMYSGLPLPGKQGSPTLGSVVPTTGPSPLSGAQAARARERSARPTTANVRRSNIQVPPAGF